MIGQKITLLLLFLGSITMCSAQIQAQDREKADAAWKTQLSKIIGDYQSLIKMGTDSKVKFALHDVTDRMTGAKSVTAKIVAPFSKGSYEAIVYCDLNATVKLRVSIFDINLPGRMMGREMINKNLRSLNLRNFTSKNFSNVFEISIGYAVNRLLRDRASFSDLYDYWYYDSSGKWIPFFIAESFDGKRDYYLFMPLPNNSISPKDIARIAFDESASFRRTLSLTNIIYVYKVEIPTTQGELLVEVPIFNDSVYPVIDSCSAQASVPLDKIPLKKGLIESEWSANGSVLNLVNDMKPETDGKHYEDYEPITIKLY